MSPVNYLTLVYRPDLDMLAARWLRQPAETETYDGYHAVLAAAEQHRCHYWLVDVRRRENANQQAASWMMKEFFPRLPERLPGRPVYLAYLFQPVHLRELEADVSIPGLNYFDGRPFQVARFSEEQAATAWLAQQQGSREMDD